jgi:hypothetical protein
MDITTIERKYKNSVFFAIRLLLAVLSRNIDVNKTDKDSQILMANEEKESSSQVRIQESWGSTFSSTKLSGGHSLSLLKLNCC